MKTLTLELSDADAASIAAIAKLFKTTPEKFAKYELLSGLNGWESSESSVIELWVQDQGRMSLKPGLVAGYEEALCGKAPKDVVIVNEKGFIQYVGTPTVGGGWVEAATA